MALPLRNLDIPGRNATVLRRRFDVCHRAIPSPHFPPASLHLISNTARRWSAPGLGWSTDRIAFVVGRYRVSSQRRIAR